MDRFEALQPVKLYVPDSKPVGNASKPSPVQFIGRLPIDLHLLVLTHLPIPDIPTYARCSRSLLNLSRYERVWETKWKAFQFDMYPHLSKLLDQVEDAKKIKEGGVLNTRPPIIPVATVDDEFGDFVQVQVAASQGEFFGEHNRKFGMFSTASSMSKPTHLSMYIRAHKLLKQYIPALLSPPHSILASLFPPPRGSELVPLLLQSRTLHLLSLWLSPTIQPLRNWRSLHASLRSAVDRYEANLLGAFDIADSRSDEVGMREAAEASWEVWDGEGEWELGRVWAEKQEIFYEMGKWKPMDNFSENGVLAFDAMDEFIKYVMNALKENGSRAVRVFPADSRVLLSFADRLAVDVVAEYVNPLLSRAREISSETFLIATAASFRETWRMVDVIMQVAALSLSTTVTLLDAEDVIYKMFEDNMDEYLDEEIETIRNSLELLCRQWEHKMAQHATVASSDQTARFLSSQNPAQVKRNLLASFTDVLLLPVTIVPKTVGAVGAAAGAAGSAAVQGIQMLNPQRWGGSMGLGLGTGLGMAAANKGYTRDFEDGGMLFDVGPDDDEEGLRFMKIIPDKAEKAGASGSSVPTNGVSPTLLPQHTDAGSAPIDIVGPSIDKLDIFLSLDVALELIHADREALKRVDSFSKYPGHYGHRVRDTIEDIFIIMLQAIAERHVKPGFELAIEQMRTFKPDEHGENRSVAPLVQFFELVHIGDTIQSMVQVYFDKELASHIDRTDFLNGVVREKKHFENALDDSVAAGLNTGTDVLMNQVEHIIITKTKPREYYPPDDKPIDLGSTIGCTEAIKCLEMHCKLVKGSTSKEVLEVFYQEIGIRLIIILQKHIKRQIISLNGGFQVIADLNAYHAFIVGLKVQSIIMDFSHLKMLGHVFVVEDAKDLAQIVRDATRYGGAYRPEDVYEFIQRRSDWKKIEKIVDKTMYNLSFKEDCIIC